MDLVNRVLFDMQQTYFTYVNVLANLGPGSAGPVPDFTELRGKVATYRADSLSPLCMRTPRLAATMIGGYSSAERDYPALCLQRSTRVYAAAP